MFKRRAFQFIITWVALFRSSGYEYPYPAVTGHSQFRVNSREILPPPVINIYFNFFIYLCLYRSNLFKQKPFVLINNIKTGQSFSSIQMKTKWILVIRKLFRKLGMRKKVTIGNI